MPFRPEHLFQPRGRAAEVIAFVLALVIGGSASAASVIANSRVERGVDVEFDAGCTSATVSSVSQLSALLVEFNDGSVERIAELERAASYVLRLAPAAVAAGRSIAALSVIVGAQGQSGTVRVLSETAFRCSVSAGDATHSASGHSG